MGTTVVIADSDPFNLSLLEEACTTAGHEVQTAMDGRSVLELVARQPPALLIIDAALPGEVGGLEVVGILRSDPELRGLTIVVVDPPADIELEVEGVLSRPYRVPEVLEELERATHEGRARRRRARESARPSSPGTPAHLLMTLEHELISARRFGRSLACFLLRGLPARELVDRLRVCLRRVDAIFVTSDHEVVVLLPETDTTGAQVAVSRVLNTIEDSQLKIGLVIAPDEADEAGDVLTLARKRCGLAHVGESA